MALKNRFLRDFQTQLRSRFAEDSISMSMSEWIEKNTTLRKKPFSYDGYEFQRQIVDDMSPNMSVIKCSQIGLTEVQIRKYLAFHSRNVGVSGIFSLPTDEMFKRVSQTRVKPMIDNDSVFNLNSVETPVRKVSLYQIGQSFAYFTGNKESDATSINADILFHDEVDLSDQEMLALFQSRLQGSDFRITQGFSTPTFEGFGIDATYKASDQHEYLARCTRCNHHNIPRFTPEFICLPGLSSDINDLTELDDEIVERIDLGAAYVRCEKCGSALDMVDPKLRSWVPRFPGRRGRGYRVSPFCVPRLTVDYIVDQLLKYKKRDAIRRFHNTVLGEPYNDSNARLSDEDILAVMKSGSSIGNPEAPVVVGIDMGITCHIVLMHLGHEHPVAFSWRQVLADNLYDEVETIMKDYNVVGGCMDRHPYTPLANDIRNLTDGLIVPVEYANTPTAPAIQIVNDELDNLSHIRGNRTMMIDTVAGAVRKRKVEFVGYGRHQSLIQTHLKEMVRIEKETATGQLDTDKQQQWGPPAFWQKLSGNDHFFHALAYAFYATRVHDALEYRSDADMRTMFATSSLTIPVQNDVSLGVKSRRREAISIGTLM